MLTAPPVVEGTAFAAGASFELPGEVEAIAPVVDEVTAFLTAQQALPGKEDEVALALQEALANAVVHGCGGDPAQTVTGQVACGPGQGAVIVVRDPGPGFDLARLPDPLSGAGLDAGGGRGVHLIRGLMDEVRFERGGRELHMRKL